MAVTYVSGNTSQVDVDGTTHTVNLPASLSSGNILFIYISFNDALTATTPSGWTALLDTDSSAVNAHFCIYTKVSNGSEGSTVDITVDTATQSSHITEQYSGTFSGSLSDVEIQSASSADDTPDSPSITASWGSASNKFLSVYLGRRGDRAPTAYPTNYTENQTSHTSANSAGGASVAVCGRTLTAATEDPGNYTLSTTNQAYASTIVIRPSAGGGGPSVAPSAIQSVDYQFAPYFITNLKGGLQ